MRVVLDLRAVHSRMTGIGRYATNLLLSLEKAGRGLDVVVLSTAAGKDFLGDHPKVTFQVVTTGDGREGDLKLPDLLSGVGADLFHSPLFVLPPIRSCPSILTVHDVIPAVRPDLTHPAFAGFFERNIERAIRGAAQLVTVSLHSQEDLLRIYPQARGRTTVIYEPVSPIFRVFSQAEFGPVLERYRLDPGYILSVGAIDGRKNLARLLEAYALLRADEGVAPPLILIGEPSGDGFRPHPHVERLDLGPHVRFLGRIPDLDLAPLYSGASLLAFPSLYEGFGLPVVEAMAAGTPVVTSRVSSLPEIWGDAALFVDPENVPSIKEGMSRILRDSQERSRLVENGLRRAMEFTLERQGEALASLYRGLKRGAA